MVVIVVYQVEIDAKRDFFCQNYKKQQKKKWILSNDIVSLKVSRIRTQAFINLNESQKWAENISQSIYFPFPKNIIF